MSKYIVVELIAKYDDKDQDKIITEIQAALGCDESDNEINCPMVTMFISVVDTLEEAEEILF